MLVFVVAPAVRRHGSEATMRVVARRFGVGSLIALAGLIASGAVLTGHYSLWGSSTLHTRN